MSIADRVHLIHNREQRFTLGYQILKPVEGIGTMIRVAEALVSPLDNFNRKIGRAVAEGRLKKAAETGRDINHVYELIIEGDFPTTGEQWRAFDAHIVRAMGLSHEEFDDEDLPF